MAEVVLYHHAQGLTTGVQAFADELRGAGHTVHLPDLYDGHTFDTLDDGVAYAQQVGFDTIVARGINAAAELGSGSDGLVYAGFSLGAMPAQKLAQTTPGAKGALLFHACIPVSEFGDAWPKGVPVQVHAMDADPFFTEDGDIDAARELAKTSDDAELFLYPGSEHLFTDSSLPSYDAEATALVLRRVTELLRSID